MNFKTANYLASEPRKTYTGLTSLTIVNPNEVKDEKKKKKTKATKKKNECDPNLCITLPK